MKLRRGSICTDPAVTRDAKALWNMAYFDDLQIESDPLGAGIKLTIRLVERPAIRKVVYKGNDELDKEDIDETITLEPGTILSVPDVESQADAMRQLYSEEGFFLADIGYELKRIPGDSNQVDVVFKIDEGAEVEVRRISFVGNKELPAAELLKIMQTNETGMFSFLSDRNKFSRSAFDEDLTRVQAWYYDKGYLQMRPGRPTVELTADRAYVDITIPVEEGPRFRIREFDVMETDGAGNEVETIAPKGRAPRDGRARGWRLVQSKQDRGGHRRDQSGLPRLRIRLGRDGARHGPRRSQSLGRRHDQHPSRAAGLHSASPRPGQYQDARRGHPPRVPA